MVFDGYPHVLATIREILCLRRVWLSALSRLSGTIRRWAILVPLLLLVRTTIGVIWAC
ncbi:hypothetical protein VN12_26190 [Pirellula sp. SH-Sr6A]|nr:hypothetical protein VN12_26190 [Pirellula sp. SH-Sr6A]